MTTAMNKLFVKTSKASFNKLQKVEAILDSLKNNVYAYNRDEWCDLELGLLKMNFRELNAMYILILGCHNFRPMPKKITPEKFATK